MPKRKTSPPDPLRERPHRMTIDFELVDWNPMIERVEAENRGKPRDQQINPTTLVRRAVREYLRQLDLLIEAVTL